MRYDRYEEVLFAGHPCWRSMFGFYMRWLLLAVVAGVVVGVFTVQGKRVQAGPVALGVVAVFALALARGAMRRAATRYTVTDRRLVIERGLLRRDVQEAPLVRVQNVFAHQTIRQRLLRIGTVHFDTSAGAQFDFCFWGVERPRDLLARVDRALSDARRAHEDEDEWEPVRVHAG